MKKIVIIIMVLMMVLMMNSCDVLFTLLFSGSYNEIDAPYSDPGSSVTVVTSTFDVSSGADNSYFLASSGSVYRIVLNVSTGADTTLTVYGSYDAFLNKPGDAVLGTSYNTLSNSQVLTFYNRNNYSYFFVEATSGGTSAGTFTVDKYPAPLQIYPNVDVSGYVSSGESTFFMVDDSTNYGSYDIDLTSGTLYMNDSDGTEYYDSDGTVYGFNPSGPYYLIEVYGSGSSSYSLVVTEY